jgi:hypothetical protein
MEHRYYLSNICCMLSHCEELWVNVFPQPSGSAMDASTSPRSVSSVSPRMMSVPTGPASVGSKRTSSAATQVHTSFKADVSFVVVIGIPMFQIELGPGDLHAK